MDRSRKLWLVLLALAAGTGLWLRWRDRAVSPPSAIVRQPARTNATVAKAPPPVPVPEPPFSQTTPFMRYELLADRLSWGIPSLMPAFWGYTNRVEVPEVQPRDLLWHRLGDDFEGLLPPLAVIRWTSDWSEFLHRWLDPRLTAPTGVGFFNPNAAYEGQYLLPISKESDFSFGLKYRWSF